MTVNNPYTWGLGRRKSAVARVRLKSGSGAFQVNGKTVTEYFTTLRDLNRAKAPLGLMEDESTYDVVVTWNVAGAETCSAFISGGDAIDFDKVVISIFDSEDAEEPIEAPAEVDCDEFTYTIPRMSRGSS